MFNNYIKNFNNLQVGNLQINIQVNVCSKDKKESGKDKKDSFDSYEEEPFDCNDSYEEEPFDCNDSYEDLAEKIEENINSDKEKYLPSKLETLKLEDIYIFFKNYGRAELIHNCGTYLEFAIARGQDVDKKRLKRLNSCKLRLCPYCAWRKSLKVFSNIRKCYDYFEREDLHKKSINKSRFIFMTLTTKNVDGENLSDEIDNILAGFKALCRTKEFKNAFSGFVRSLEVVCDREARITSKMFNRAKDYYKSRGLSIGSINPNYLKFNVHIHVVCHTTYLRYQENYIDEKDNKELTKLWRKSLAVDYDPIVNVKSFKPKSREEKGRELAELAKYTVKPTDYLRAKYKRRRWSNESSFDDNDFKLDAYVIGWLDYALKGRRLLSFAGTFRKAYQTLKLEDDKMLNKSELSEIEEIILKYYFNFYDLLYKRFV